MSNRTLKILVVVLALLLVAGVTAYAVSNYGSAEDPLVAKSYLDSVLRPELEQQLRQEMADALASGGAADGEFHVLTLRAGQRVICEVGTELLPRLGTVHASGSDFPVLLDTSTGDSIENARTLSANHMYIVSIAGNGFTADSNNVKVLISGAYRVE